MLSLLKNEMECSVSVKIRVLILCKRNALVKQCSESVCSLRTHAIDVGDVTTGDAAERVIFYHSQ